MRPETTLLLYCAVPALESVHSAQIQGVLSSSDIDTEAFCTLVTRHGLIPVVYRNLQYAATSNTSRGESVKHLLNKLRHMNLTVAAHSARITHELFRILDLFKSKNIQAVPVKGPVLAVQAYGDITMRQYCDIDLIIPYDQILQAGAILKTDGFMQNGELTERQAQWLVRTGQEWSFYKEGIFVDMKPRLASHLMQSKSEAESAINRAAEQQIYGRSIKTLTIEDAILASCMHGVQHRWGELKWVTDIAALIHNHQIDWQLLGCLANASGAERMLLHSLILAEEMLGAALPTDIQTAINKDRVTRQLAGEVITDITEERGIRPLRRWRYKIRCWQRVRYKVRFILRQALLPELEDTKILILPECLFPLYSVLRLLRLLRTKVLNRD